MYKVWQNKEGLFLTIVPVTTPGRTRYTFNTTSLLQEAYVARNIPLYILGHDKDIFISTFDPTPIKISL